LKKVSAKVGSQQLTNRVREGEALLFGRRCSDGGWNAGNPNVLNFDLPSYPETTALALIGLQGRASQELAAAISVAQKFRGEAKSSLAKAWLSIALRCYGVDIAPPVEAERTSGDVMLNALEALGHPAGNYSLFRPGGRA